MYMYNITNFINIRDIQTCIIKTNYKYTDKTLEGPKNFEPKLLYLTQYFIYGINCKISIFNLEQFGEISEKERGPILIKRQ